MRSILCWCCVLIVVTIVQGYQHDAGEYAKDPWKGIPMLCSVEDPKNISISCHGVRIVKRVIQQLLESAAHAPRIEITEGISIVDIDDGRRRSRNMRHSILGFLEGRELRVKLQSFLPENFENVVKKSLPKGRAGDGGGGGGLGGFGGGGKKGDNSFMIMALMMGKMLGAMGFGALSLLAMKALMVSSLALMLSLIVAAKKFASSGSSDSGHHVVYAQEVSSGHGHHTRRSSQNDEPEISPYRGYIHLSPTPKPIR